MGLISSINWALRDQAVIDFTPASISGGTGIPSLNMNRWGAQIDFGDVQAVRRDVEEIEGGFEFTLPGGCLLRLSEQSLITFPDTVAWTPEHGLLKVDLLLASIPEVNTFPFELILPTGTELNYQPELTQEEIDGGVIRPEWCVGSYACYAADGRKLGHLPRPFAVDDDGNWTWGVLDWNPLTGILAKTIPQAWLDVATYPVLVDDTFGFTDTGATSHDAGPDYQSSCGPFSPTSDGTADKVYLYVHVNGRKTTCGIFDESDSEPDQLLRDTNEVTTTTETWNEFVLDSTLSVSNGTNYYIGWNNDDGSTQLRYDTAGPPPQSLWYQSQAYTSGSLVNYGSPNTTPGRKYSIYVNYTPSGATLHRLTPSPGGDTWKIGP